jgi:DNA-binding CsgD family transcriptional regulator
MSTPANGRGINRFPVPSAAGLILLDDSRKPVYFNPEAIKVLAYSEHLKNLDKLTNSLPNEIKSLLCRPECYGDLSLAEFMSGRRHYVCRAFRLNHNSGISSRMITGLLIERSAPKFVNIRQVAEQFHLTQREQETVGLLTLGLTSKEIATRMNISPNTVKAFFRLVMTKMAVSTRSGIVGKIARM